MIVKVELQDSEASRLRDEWEQRALSYEEQAASLREAVASIDAQLNGKLPSKASSPAVLTETAPASKAKKRKKGENLRTIKGFLAGLSGKGATVAEIRKGAGIAVSSAVAVLTKNEKVFEKGNDGLWRLK